MRIHLQRIGLVTASLLAASCSAPEGDPSGGSANALGAGPDEVAICHRPPGNPSNEHTIVVGKAAVKAHLRHGDLLGPCVVRCGSDADCEDGDACTTDTCSAGGECAHAARECNDGDACTADSCDPVTGCHAIPIPGPEPSEITCGDGLDNDCDGLVDQTDPDCVVACPVCDVHATCQGSQTPPCVCNEGYSGDGLTCARDGTGCWDAIDNDGDGLTDCKDVEGCSGQLCDLGDICSTGYENRCDDLGRCMAQPPAPNYQIDCCFSASQCLSGGACSMAICNPPETGINGGCRQIPRNCDDQDACTVDGCSPTEGCTHAPAACEDGNPCTTNECDSVIGCIFRAIPGCCQGDPALCVDGNLCTVDTCLASGACGRPQLDCDDGDLCTLDTCDPTVGCKRTPTAGPEQPEATCDDGLDNDCDGLTDLEDPHCSAGCQACDPNAFCQPLQSPGCVCNEGYGGDGLTCVRDGTGCWDAIDNDGDGLTDCKDVEGCNGQLCDLADICSVSFENRCDVEGRCVAPGSGGGAHLDCCFSASQCLAFGACNVPICKPPTDLGGGCQQIPRNCDDHDVCTIDSCAEPLGCSHEPNRCDDGNPCTADSCHPAIGCTHSPISGCVAP